MFVMTHRSVRVLLATVLTVICGSTALAGGRETSPPVVDSGARFASGNMSAYRLAMTNNSRIGCTINSENVISCTAIHQISLGTCTKFFPSEAMMNAVMALQSDSYLYFAWDTRGVCTQIIVENSSKWEPKR